MSGRPTTEGDAMITVTFSDIDRTSTYQRRGHTVHTVVRTEFGRTARFVGVAGPDDVLGTVFAKINPKRDLGARRLAYVVAIEPIGNYWKVTQTQDEIKALIEAKIGKAQ
jgi:hypothetical protein